ncbi:MAG: DUF1559 domain-containing protein, partial [Planctomycetaceae bacterium]|nr:DUF1559 domain-containing protein [Planctomycetaceae bacterium]
ISRRICHRKGLTRIELVVVLGIIGTVLAVVLPGMQRVRARARQAECLNNMRQVGLAAINYSASFDGAFPKLIDSAGGEVFVSERVGTIPTPWTVAVIPLIEGSPLYEDLLSPARDQTFEELAAWQMPVYRCPSSPFSHQRAVNSYVANGGYMTLSRWNNASRIDNGHSQDGYDWQADGVGLVTEWDRQITKATGVVFSGSSTNYEDIGDGTSATILLSENVDTVPFDPATGEGGWISRAPGNLCFALPIAEQGSSSAPASIQDDAANGVGDVSGDAPKANMAQALSLHSSFSLATTKPSDFRVGRINSRNRNASAGNMPRPSSNHPGGVNIILVDGSGRFLSEDIDDSVYARMISSNGEKHGQSPFDNVYESMQSRRRQY